MHANGVVVGVFSAAEWLPVTTSNGFPVDSPGRLGFVGTEAELAIANHYMGRAVPERCLHRNPVAYCDM